MSLSIEIQKKPKEKIEVRQVCKPVEVFNLKEVQEIRDAVQEHLLFIGLDRKNNIRNISLLGIGSSSEIKVDSKYIVRTALVTASDKVILVHNHPSNVVEPSNVDKQITNITNKLLKTFNIELVDHIIVAENDFLSMLKINAINKDYEDDRTRIIDTTLLLEENNRLKEEIKNLNNKLQEKERIIEENEEEFE